MNHPDTEADPGFEAEKEAARRRIRFLMEFWQIKPEDIAYAARQPAAPPAEPVPLPPRYRHPVSGDTWDGAGSQPDWLRRALLQEGYTVEELRIVEEPSTADEVQPPTR
ncbi:H-NS histone family protein [Schlegelella sp. S2-27]|uniref:H-NS histone family protein n=1 Tax=Caldimonas mangrovi TaxID=2944811 RepID=A0ABT0YU51_9BURK|nr:H-NS family nucleoid-associated regulatory protein [Caldimonas mangrovi]MCM5682269.1 H-NS histone family protein [Caldimonas mangrovi]